MQTPQREWYLRPGDFRGASAARHEFVRYLRSKRAKPDQRDDAALIFGELVVNAVKCARSTIVVEVLEDGWTSLRVTDDGDCFDKAVIAPQPHLAESGRGLYLVNQLARNLDISKRDSRCEVTAELSIRS